MRRRGLPLKILAAADPPAELRPPLAERTRGPQVLGKAVVLHLDDGTGSKKFACGLLDACSGVGIPSSWDGTNWADDESACTNLGGSDAGCETLLATPDCVLDLDIDLLYEIPIHASPEPDLGSDRRAQVLGHRHTKSADHADCYDNPC